MDGSQNRLGVSEIDFTSDNVCLSTHPLSLVQKNDKSRDISDSFSAPKNAEQLSKCLLDVETAKTLLASKMPLGELRPLMVGCYMRYHAIREILKDSESNFFIDKIIHVNRDGIRFKHCRDNSYRSIHKIKEPEKPVDQRGFNLWINDMKKWSEPLPLMDLQLLMLDSIRKAVFSITKEENQPFDPQSIEKSRTDAIQMPCDISRTDLTKLVITIEEMVKLIDYGRDVFDHTVTGFYAQVWAPPNPSDKKVNEEQIFMDQIIGVSWATKPYLMFRRPLTIVLKFRHFRDERLCQLPYWNKCEGISQEIYDQWLNDMRHWDEEYPSSLFIEKKANTLATVLSRAPRGPPVDVIKVAAIEAERENSTKLLKKLKEWQEEQNVGSVFFQPFPPHRQPYSLSHFPHWPFSRGPFLPGPFPMYGMASSYLPHINPFRRPMDQSMIQPSPVAYYTPPFVGFQHNPQNIPTQRFRPKAPKHRPMGDTKSAIIQKAYFPSSTTNFSARKSQLIKGEADHQFPNPRNDHTTFHAPFTNPGNAWF